MPKIFTRESITFILIIAVLENSECCQISFCVLHFFQEVFLFKLNSSKLNRSGIFSCRVLMKVSGSACNVLATVVSSCSHLWLSSMLYLHWRRQYNVVK